MKENVKEIIPAVVFPPGEHIKDELEVRGWTQDYLAQIWSKKKSYISELIHGKRDITIDVALDLSNIFGISEDFWIKLQINYTRYKQRMKEGNIKEDLIKCKSFILDNFPLSDMEKRGWIPAYQDVKLTELTIKNYFGIDTIEQKPSFLCAARKNDYNTLDIKQIAWLKRAEMLAVEKAKTLPLYQHERFCEDYIYIKSLLSTPEKLPDVIKLYHDLGVVIVVVKAMKKMDMQAGNFWLEQKRPVIALTLLRDSFDRFWFTFLHETAHIIYKDALEYPIMDDMKYKDDKPEFEKRADKFAEDILIDPEKYLYFQKSLFGKPQHHVLQKAKEFSKEYNIHFSIVTGRLQNDGILPWNISSQFIGTQKILSYLKEYVPWDG